jgi:hypothetical protein
VFERIIVNAMLYRFIICVFLSALSFGNAIAQKPFTEGTIVYKVRLANTDQKMIYGTYTFSFKGTQLRKELKLENGYRDIELFNITANAVYSLQDMNGKKYAIQLSMSDILKAQEPFTGYAVSNEQNAPRHIPGCASFKANLKYRDGALSDFYYTRDWKPAHSITFERFPNAQFIPLNYSYKNTNGMTMEFEADKLTPGPVESSAFRIPPDYKMISNEEYRQMNK